MKYLNNAFQNLTPLRNRGESLSKNRDPNMTHNEHIYAIYCRPEVADDVISSQNVETFWDYFAVTLWVGSFSSFREQDLFNMIVCELDNA